MDPQPYKGLNNQLSMKIQIKVLLQMTSCNRIQVYQMKIYIKNKIKVSSNLILIMIDRNYYLNKIVKKII